MKKNSNFPDEKFVNRAVQLPCVFRGKRAIIEWLGLEEMSKIIKFQPPCSRQGCQLLDHLTQVNHKSWKNRKCRIKVMALTPTSVPYLFPPLWKGDHADGNVIV